MSEANSGQPSGESAQETTRRRLAPQVSFKSDPSYENGKGRGGGDVPKKAGNGGVSLFVTGDTNIF